MKTILNKLKESVIHLQVLDDVLYRNSEMFRRIESQYSSKDFKNEFADITKQIYAGGKSSEYSRQMILGDLILYIMSGRAYFYASKDKENLKHFLKLTLYVVNQMLLYDLITTNPKIRLEFLKNLEKKINKKRLYENEGDELLIDELKKRFKNVKLWDKDYKRFDDLMDSLMPKTLGAPKELIVYAELIRLKKGYVLPLLLIQRLLGDDDIIAPPDFLLLKKNKNIFGIELGYNKESQSR